MARGAGCAQGPGGWRRLSRGDDAPGSRERPWRRGGRWRLLCPIGRRGRATAAISTALGEAAEAWGARAGSLPAGQGRALPSRPSSRVPPFRSFKPSGVGQGGQPAGLLAEGVRRASSVFRVVLGGRGGDKEKEDKKERRRRESLRGSPRAAALGVSLGLRGNRGALATRRPWVQRAATQGCGRCRDNRGPGPALPRRPGMSLIPRATGA